MSPAVLHVLSQRPGRTGSGVTLDALVRHAAEAGWDQRALVGTSADDPTPTVGNLRADRVRALVFATGELDFALPGMSDVMPYESSRFSELTDGQWERYRAAWRGALTEVGSAFRPDVVHTHHVWLASALAKDVFPNTPVVTHSHATGLRQLELCPDRAAEVLAGVRRNDAFCALHALQAQELRATLDVPADRIHVVGAGYREDLFHSEGRGDVGPALLYAGKLSRAKGFPWLLDACERLAPQVPGLRLHVAGSGAGAEAEELRTRMRELGDGVVYHGPLDQAALAELMRAASVFVLPSLYEGLPLVLVEAAACGCRIVATDLPGVGKLATSLEEVLERVTPPRCRGVDEPVAEDLPAFVGRLETALARGLRAPASRGVDLSAHRWRAVFDRVEGVWSRLLGAPRSG